jgi:hypothetical protein
MGVTWELVGLAMRQVAVKWSTTDDGRVAGIGVGAGKEGDMGRRQWADRRWWETGGLDVV